MNEKCQDIMVCIDSFNGSLAKGRIVGLLLNKEISFSGLDQMLLILEDVMNRTGCPVRDMPLRQRIRVGSEAMGEEKFIFNNVDDSVRIIMGKLISFHICIHYRRNYSIQGLITIMDDAHDTIAFRSGMELLVLIYNTLKNEKKF